MTIAANPLSRPNAEYSSPSVMEAIRTTSCTLNADCYGQTVHPIVGLMSIVWMQNAVTWFLIGAQSAKLIQNNHLGSYKHDRIIYECLAAL